MRSVSSGCESPIQTAACCVRFIVAPTILPHWMRASHQRLYACVERKVVKDVNPHHRVALTRRQGSQILVQCVWKAMDDGSLLVAAKDIQDSDSTGAGLRNAILITKVGTSTCRVRYIDTVTFSSRGTREAAKASALSVTMSVKHYFQCIQELADYDVVDGNAIGEAISIKTAKEKMKLPGTTYASIRLRHLCKTHKGLREFSKDFPFFEPMVANLIINRVKPVAEVSTKWCNLSQVQGERIGASFRLILLSNVSINKAVAEWIAKHTEAHREKAHWKTKHDEKHEEKVEMENYW